MEGRSKINPRQQGQVVCINPNLVLNRRDVFTTGIVYMPIGLAYFVGELKKTGFSFQVIDAFGESPNKTWIEDEFIYRGIHPSEIIEKINHGPIPKPDAFFIYAVNLTYHRAIVEIVKHLKRAFNEIPITILENTQAVTAYSLENVQDELYEAGADFVLMGEPEYRGIELLKLIKSQTNDVNFLNIDGIGFKKMGEKKYTLPETKVDDLDVLSFPAWEYFPVKNYWRLRYSHGPLSEKKYLPILTSRGCPYKCQFCVIPKTNSRQWRYRSAKNVVDEMEFWVKKWQIKEFHIEDVNPTVYDPRTQEICREIIQRGLKISWKISAGTKVETIKSKETIRLMAKAGCRYISISPESGSPKVMKAINKTFKYDHSVDLVKEMNRVGIYSQACFVLGYPQEDDEDRLLTRKMVYELTRSGVSEIALFIITPVPGSQIYDKFSGYTDYSQLNFSPTWREDYLKLNRFRVKLYREFLIWKFVFHPLKLLKQPFSFVFRRFNTKMEMVPYRALHTLVLLLKAGKRSLWKS